MACGEGGHITATDNDRIEVSNLSRQFLFRETNVGQNKSTAASEAVRAMNPAIKVGGAPALFFFSKKPHPWRSRPRRETTVGGCSKWFDI